MDCGQITDGAAIVFLASPKYAAANSNAKGSQPSEAQTIRARMGIRLDPNALWTVETSIKFGRELEGILEYLEETGPGRPLLPSEPYGRGYVRSLMKELA